MVISFNTIMMDFESVKKELTVLVVDDRVENIYILENILEEADYKVLKATSGNQAIELLRSNPVDLILLDVMMPMMDGFQTAVFIKKELNLVDIPIIFLTARDDKESVVEGFKLGANDYLTKPFDVNELLVRVETHLKLKYQSDQLNRINETLELKVKQRTFQLQEKSHELEIAYQNLKKAYRDLNELDQIKDNFLKIISHEIRTPLNAIIGYVALMEDVLVDEVEVRDYLQLLRDGTDRMEYFSNATLLLTELQTKRVTLSIKPVSLKHLVQKEIKSLDSLISTRKISVSTHVDDRLLIQGDERLVSKALHAVIQNAVEHTKQESKVTITSLLVPTGINLQIRDYGEGFTDVALKNLFKSFSTDIQRADQSLGLGLKTTKLIMDYHHGDIQIKNRENGAEVTLSFPLE